MHALHFSRHESTELSYKCIKENFDNLISQCLVRDLLGNCCIVCISSCHQQNVYLRFTFECPNSPIQIQGSQLCSKDDHHNVEPGIN